MSRFTSLFAFVALCALSAISCAGGPGDDRAIRRPVPAGEGLSDWLELQIAEDSEYPAFFIQMADPQLGMSGSPLWLALFGATWNDDAFQVDAKLFESAIAHANELEPAFVVICGDLVNRVGHAGQIAEFQRISSTLNRSIPLYLVAGNHDVGNEPTKESLRAYRATFGPDWYSFRQGAVYGIVLNSQLIDAPEEVPGEARDQLAWLRDELIRAQSSGVQHILVFQHQSYFLEKPDEADQYFNIDAGSRAVYLALLKNSGVEAVFAGHYHRNAHGRDGTLEMITTGPVGKPLGDDPSGFRIVAIGEDSLGHEYFALEKP
jgi:3',5'-cyclic AMP phosphodiesterase CpdA